MSRRITWPKGFADKMKARGRVPVAFGSPGVEAFTGMEPRAAAFVEHVFLWLQTGHTVEEAVAWGYEHDRKPEAAPPEDPR